MNKFEKIKSMNVDDLAFFIQHSTSCIGICSFYPNCDKDETTDCTAGIKEWLLSEYNETFEDDEIPF